VWVGNLKSSIGLEKFGHKELPVGEYNGGQEGKDGRNKAKPEDDGHTGARGGHVVIDCVGDKFGVCHILDRG